MVKSAMLDRVREKSPTGWIGRTRVFLAQVQNEVARVTWPTWKEVQATTLVVILTSILFGIYLWGADLVLDRVARVLFTTFGAS